MPHHDFIPSWPLTNGHLQSLMASMPMRRPLEKWRARDMLQHSEDMIFNCGDGIRLHGHYSPQPTPSKQLLVLIHGWEGSSESLYLLSAAGFLYQQGYDVMRLHLRDHGPSHHLNRELFNSSRDAEVAGALQDINSCLHPDNMFLAGFSLGGNFALRVGLRAGEYNFHLKRIVAVCPVLYPPATMESLAQGWALYHHYFIKKWKRSLREKLNHFPEHDYQDKLLQMNSLQEMTDYFVEHHTEFNDSEIYLETYSIIDDRLKKLHTPSLLLAAVDDPVIPANDIHNLVDNPNLKIKLTQHGGHCGYIKNWSMRSWANDEILRFLKDEPA